MTQEAGSQSNKEEVKLLPIAEMEKMSHSDLYRARSNAKTTEEQKHIAPYEHRAFAREFVEEKPILGAASLAVAIPGYQAAKAIGAHGTRTGVDMKQVVEGYKGVGEGLSKGVLEPWKRVWNRVEEAVNPPAPKDVPVKPWERAWKQEQEVKPTVSSKLSKRSKAEDEMSEKVKLTPAEQAKGDAYDLTDANINELTTEISRTTDTGVKAILQAELERLTQRRKR